MDATALVWFRLDLRLRDNPALDAAARSGCGIVPVFIWAPEEEGGWPPGAASRWWLHRSLAALAADLERRGSGLVLRRGPSLESLGRLIGESGAGAVYWNRRVEPALRQRDARVLEALRAEGVKVETCNGSLLYDPGEIHTAGGGPFRVFTPFSKACTPLGPALVRAAPPIRPPRRRPESLPLGSLELLPAHGWTEGLGLEWEPGERGAEKLLRRFAASALRSYAVHRDYPATEGTSRLSPHLHFGELSPWQVVAACARRPAAEAEGFLRQLLWREFAHHLLHHFPHTPENPLRPGFARFPWRQDPPGIRAWQQGRTGFSFVDAGMRQLRATGWMHNRARMIAGSFLVKDLLVPWLEGARWFWDTLVDADLANNTLGWQWVAGCGADAAPYFRIFNPERQAEKFDPGQAFTRRWVPELGTPRYPPPVVDHRMARERALAALARIKGV